MTSGRPIPRVTEYLAALPTGLDSFPSYRAKGSMFRSALEVRSTPRDLTLLPPRIARLFRDPPLSSQWVPETEYVAFSLAMADLHGMSDADFCQYWYDVMLNITDGLYAAALSLVSPVLILRTLASRWGTFHQGVDAIALPTPGGLLIRLTFPTRLFSPLIIDGYVAVFQALISRSRRPAATAKLDGVNVVASTTEATIRLVDFID